MLRAEVSAHRLEIRVQAGGANSWLEPGEDRRLLARSRTVGTQTSASYGKWNPPGRTPTTAWGTPFEGRTAARGELRESVVATGEGTSATRLSRPIRSSLGAEVATEGGADAEGPASGAVVPTTARRSGASEAGAVALP